VARSYVREARLRGLGRRRERIARSSSGSPKSIRTREIALRFRSDLELLVSVMLSRRPPT
jgi:hypothetical protein